MAVDRFLSCLKGSFSGAMLVCHNVAGKVVVDLCGKQTSDIFHKSHNTVREVYWR